MTRSGRMVTIVLALATACLAAVPAADDDPLARGFRTPPDAAKPRVWWHWMNGNVTKEGITRDLEWMKRVGIGGMQMFDGNLGTPQFVEQRLVWMTPEWKAAFRHAAAEADRLGLEMTMAASGGWSESGGPWVKPEQAMKKVVWSETRVTGPQRFSGLLPQPPAVAGFFQNIPRPPGFDFPTDNALPGAKPIDASANANANAGAGTAPAAPVDPKFYADTKVIAFRVPPGDARMADAHPTVTSSAAALDLTPVTDGDLSKPIELPVPEGAAEAWIQFEFAEPFRARTFTFAGTGGGQFTGPAMPVARLVASQDRGATWTTVVSMPGVVHPFSGFPVRTYAFTETSARLFRIVFDPPKPSMLAALFGLPARRAVDVAEIDLGSGPRVSYWQEKAQFGNLAEFDAAVRTPDVPAGDAIAHADVIDVSSKMRADGTLDWDVPAGEWVVLRMGYSLTGQQNAPASPEATGYEVDKLDRAAVDAYFDRYLDLISGALGPYFGKSFRFLLMDSWEAGMENWTGAMIPEFQARRGYDPTPFLPVLTGRVVGSADESERFLWDFRRTIADLLAEHHYGAAAEHLAKRGLGLYGESMGSGAPTTGDGLQDKGRVTIPMSEFWTTLPGQSDTPEHPADVREAASAAHIYGKTLVAAESFTSMPFIPAWGQSPYYLKPIGDAYMAMGVNRIVFHTSVHQPFVDDAHRPGMTLGFFGQHYSRNITWAEQAVAWNTYLARSCYLLQQGRFVADLAFYYGEGAPATVPFWKPLDPKSPAGYNYDYLNTEVLLTRMSVDRGRLVLPDGMSYRVLVIPADLRTLTLPVLRKLRDLVAAGATIVAPKPTASPSLTGYPSSDAELRAMADEVWGEVDGTRVTSRAYRAGRVYWGVPLQEVLDAQAIAPDVDYDHHPQADSTPTPALTWIHRRDVDRNAEIYFVANQQPRAEAVTVRFRVSGKQAELWHPDTGTIEPASYAIAHDRTAVPLRLDPYGSVFVIFRRNAVAPSRVLPVPVRTELSTIDGPWQVSFPPNLGAPPAIALDALASWTMSADAGVKYFSGTATYTRTLDAPRAWFRPGARLVIDLGGVKEIAEVSVNGKPLGILWKPPFDADVTAALVPGSNRLEIKITNLWPNRMIGDLQPPSASASSSASGSGSGASASAGARTYTFTDFRPYKPDAPLLESGLLGPVRVYAVAPTPAVARAGGR